MPYTSPASWTVGQLVSAAELNTYLRDNMLFLAGTAGVMPGMHMTAPVVDSGGLTVTLGNMGIGAGVSDNIGLQVAGFVNAAVTGYGILAQPTLSATANGDNLIGMEIAPTYNVNGHSGVNGIGVLIPGPANSGSSNNYTLELSAPTGGSSSNIALFITGGGANIYGGVTVATGGLIVSASGFTVTGASLLIGNLGVTGGITATAGVAGTYFGDLGTASATGVGRYSNGTWIGFRNHLNNGDVTIGVDLGVES